MTWKYLTPLAALALYLVGLVAHEGTHVLAVWLTGSKLHSATIYPPEVAYVASTGRRDALIRMSTVLVTVPMLVAYMLFLREDVWSWRLLGLAVVAGYIPRSNSDWEPVATWLKSVAV